GTIRHEILESAKKGVETMSTVFLENLIEVGEKYLIIELVETANLTYGAKMAIVRDIEVQVDEHQYRRACSAVATEALEIGATTDAVQFLIKAKDNDRLSTLYEELLEEPVENFDELWQIADSDADFTREREGQLFKNLMFESEVSESAALFMVNWYKRNKIGLVENDREKVCALIGERIDIDTVKDFPELQLAWAEANYEQYPIQAHRIFVAMGYEGREKGETVREAITKQLPLDSFSKQEVRDAITGAFMPRDARALRYVGDNIALLKLSKKEAEERPKHAYGLWMEAKGKEEEHVQRLRFRLYEAELEKHRHDSNNWGRKSFDWLDPEDSEGITQVMNLALNEHPCFAYLIAEKFSRGRAQAVATMIEQDRFNALNFLAAQNHHEGIGLALEAIEVKDGVKASELKKYVPEEVPF
ncbi:hypothetical protein ACFLZN_01915, partial [Nanoarchaeota archaeon]